MRSREDPALSFVRVDDSGKTVNAYLLAVIGGLGGAAAGFFIGRFFESKTLGACPILCNPKISTIFFAVLGIMIATGGK